MFSKLRKKFYFYLIANKVKIIEHPIDTLQSINTFIPTKKVKLFSKRGLYWV